MSEKPSRDLIPEAYAKLYEPYKQKADAGKYQSLFDGYEKTIKAKVVTVKPNLSSISTVPFTALLERAYPGLELVDQIKHWNDLRDTFWTVEEVRDKYYSQEIASIEFGTWSMVEMYRKALIEMNEDHAREIEFIRQKASQFESLSLRDFIKENWPSELRRGPSDCNKKIRRILGDSYALPKGGDKRITKKEAEQLKLGWKSISKGNAARHSIQAANQMRTNAQKSPANKPDYVPKRKKKH